MTDMTTAVDTAAVAKNGPGRPADGDQADLVAQLVEQARAAGLQLTGDDEVAQALREWLSAQSRLEVTLRSGFAKKVPIDFDELAALNGDETRAWQHFRAVHLMREGR